MPKIFEYTNYMYTHTSFIECSIEIFCLVETAPFAPSRRPARHRDECNGFPSRDEFKGFPSPRIVCTHTSVCAFMCMCVCARARARYCPIATARGATTRIGCAARGATQRSKRSVEAILRRYYRQAGRQAGEERGQSAGSRPRRLRVRHLLGSARVATNPGGAGPSLGKERVCVCSGVAK